MFADSRALALILFFEDEQPKTRCVTRMFADSRILALFFFFEDEQHGQKRRAERRGRRKRRRRRTARREVCVPRVLRCKRQIEGAGIKALFRLNNLT